MKKKNTWTKVFALLTVAALGLTACGTADTGSTNNDKQSNDKVAAAGITDSKDDDSTTGDLITIRVGVCAGDDRQYLKILDNHTDFLKERGINYETTEFAAGINTIDAITTGQIDIGNFADYAGVNRIGNTLGENELRAFAATGKSDLWSLYVNPEKIKEASDFEKATVINMPGVVTEYDYGKLYETYDIDPDKVGIANVSSAQEALAVIAAGDGDAYWTGAQVKDQVESYGWEPFTNLTDIDALMYGYLVSTETYLTEHKEDLKKFLEVSDEAAKYITDNLDEFAEWVEEDLGLSKERVIAGWQAAEHQYTFDQESYDDLIKVKDWCFAHERFDTDYKIKDYVNTDALAEVFPDRVTWSATE